MKVVTRVLFALLVVTCVTTFFPSLSFAQVTQCRVTTAAPTYPDGTIRPLSCDEDGNLRSSATLSGGGDASAAKQDEQTAILTTIDTDTSAIAVSLAALEALLDALSGTELQVDIVSGTVSATTAADATVAAPSYMEGTSNPLSQTLAGDLRVTGAGGTFPVTGTFWQATQPVSGTVAVTGTQTDGLTDTELRAAPVVVDLGANNDVTVSGVSTAANQATVIGHVDGIEALLGTIDADTSTLASTAFALDTSVDGIEGLLTTIDADTSLISAAHAATAGAVPANASQAAYRSDGGLAAGTAALTTPVICQNSVPIDTATSGNVELVALTTSETIYICGFSVVADAAVQVQLIYGTGTACATGETSITGDYSLAANGGVVIQNPYSWAQGAVSNAVCIELSGAVQINGHLNYTKF